MKWVGSACLALLIAGCGATESRPRTVSELEADSAVLPGLIARCDADRRAAAADVECVNARQAMEHIAAAIEARHVAEREAEFERQRELHRAREDRERRAAAAAQPTFDPYSSPMMTDPAGVDPKKP
jgi:hypothetical protein